MLIPRHYCLTICLCLLNAIFITFPADAQPLIFNHLTVEDGLSNNEVYSVLQDRTGFIWFAAEDGLNRFDGYNFQIFRNDPEDTASISDNSVWSLMEDSEGMIWAGTMAGFVNKYDPSKGTFTSFRIKSDITVNNSITSLYEDSRKNIWIGTYKDGLYRLSSSSGKIDHWNHDQHNSQSLSHNYVQSIIEDNRGNIIVGTYIGLNVFDPERPSAGFRQYYHRPGDPYSLSDNLVWSLSRSKTDPDIIWICTANNLSRLNTFDYSITQVRIPNPDNLQYGSSCNSIIERDTDKGKIIDIASYSGLVTMDLRTGLTQRYVHNENDARSLINNHVNKLIKDRSGVMWIATENGISYVTPKSGSFNSITAFETGGDPLKHLRNMNITAVCGTQDDKTWIGTSDGLYLLPALNAGARPERIGQFNGHHIWSLASAGNEVWVGTFGKGLSQYNYIKKSVTKRDISDPGIRTQSLYYNKTILADSRDNIWVGYWGIGVSRIDPSTGEFTIFLNDPEDPQTISHNDVWVIKEDGFGRIWLGTAGGGLNLFEDKDGGIFHHWVTTEEGSPLLSSNNIYSLYIEEQTADTAGSITVLWIGTSSGLNRVEVKNEGSTSGLYNPQLSGRSYSVNDGLPDNSVNSILADASGNLWLGTGSGISLFDVEKQTFTNFNSADGINGSKMNPEAALKTADGLMLFGSTRGINIFDPQEIELSSYKPRVVITDFQIFNKSVETGPGSPLRQSIHTADKITLSPDQDVFSFGFAALDYNSPQSVRYAYMMEGFDDDWVQSGSRRFATYTNLDPGRYVFKVKSTNADGVWNNDFTSLTIIIDPPWWKTGWAYGLYFILILAGLLSIRQFEINRSRLRNELKLREFEVQKKSELEEMKSRFFANLSHEFRTPLMLIKGPLEQLKRNKDEKTYSENLDLIERNSTRLGTLIDQLLELSKLEKASIPVKAKKQDLVPLLAGLISSFDSIAIQKNITLERQYGSGPFTCLVDNDKFEKIINNLLSNAFKFTPAGGNVRVTLTEEMRRDTRTAVIKISDTGEGIPEDKLDKVFERFYQVDNSIKRAYGGSGIGLALVKELVNLHNWDIAVSGRPGPGTEFTLSIPMEKEHVNEGETPADRPPAASSSPAAGSDANLPTGNTEQSAAAKHSSSRNGNKPIVLVVDDSEDVRKYLTDLLHDSYNIIGAANGEEGISSAAENIPDLIISDVMMPSMDGMEFCGKIKSNWQTSHIPVILLTARASAESRIEGLETGADDYLVKPFDSRELLTRAANLIEQRKRLKEKYLEESDSITESSRLNKADKEFLEKTREIVERNISKTDFSTELLAKELYVSRTQLHRKILSITGMAPGEFVRTIKLKRAADLLKEGKLSVTQAAYEIGFSSPAQFSRAFAKYFNCSPSEFASRYKA